MASECCYCMMFFTLPEQNDNFPSAIRLPSIWIEEIRNVCSIDKARGKNQISMTLTMSLWKMFCLTPKDFRQGQIFDPKETWLLPCALILTDNKNECCLVWMMRTFEKINEKSWPCRCPLKLGSRSRESSINPLFCPKFSWIVFA